MLEAATEKEKSEVNSWLQQVFEGGAVSTKTDSEREEITMLIDPAGSTNGFKPSNVGFGYSYILSILTAMVMAKNGAKLLVENPEAHLHPSAQARLVRVIMELSKEKNLQVFIETHSDHVLHGVQIAVKEHVIPKDDLAILFFSFDEDEENLTRVKQLNVTADGHIERPPYGFFDQAEQDLGILIGYVSLSD